MRFIFAFYTIFFIQSVYAQDNSTLRLIFTGDIMGHDSQIESALNTGNEGYDYNPCFDFVRSYFSSADMTIGNLEVTLAGPPYKGYPQFSSPDELGVALLETGFDVLLTANNHALDRGRSGIERTINTLDSMGFIHTGTFTDQDERDLRYPLVIEKNGIRLGLLNYTYGTNGLKVEEPNVINYIDTARIQADLRKVSVAEPDFVIVTVHWGNEYELTENEQQKELAQFMLEHGADAIIGSHPHVVQPIRFGEQGQLIVYSMGNLLSNQRSRYRNGGIAVEVLLQKIKDRTFMSDYAYLPLWVYKPETEKGNIFQLVPAAIDSITAAAINMPPDQYLLMDTFLKDTRTNLSGNPEVLPIWMQGKSASR